ncbi:MAG: Electron transfer flavoprotein subunit beta [Subtercola sp.]|nr:Electron transfer flavoprotein subunit beta [Subtercola sp.]
MKIIVLVKEVPDTYGDRKLSLETGIADRAASEAVLDEIGERSLEVALSFADENPKTDVVVMSMSPESSKATIVKALAMGAASAVHIVDDTLSGADLGLTAEALAAAISRAGFDLVIAGNQSTDGTGGVIPAMVAELLEVPQLTALRSVTIEPDSVGGVRVSDNATLTVSSRLPAVISVTESLPDARFANFKGILAAKKKPYEMISLAELGVQPDNANSARSIMVAVSEAPPRAGGVKIVDQGDAGEKIAEFLIANRVA